MSISVVTAAIEYPLSLQDLKEHLSILNDDWDTYLETLIAAATRQCEVITHQTAIATTFKQTFRCWPSSGVFVLDNPPLSSVTSVVYTDSDGAEQTLATTEYTVDTVSKPGRVLRAYEKTWPIVRSQGVAEPIQITYVAGYATQSAVPVAFQQAMKLICAHWFLNREAVNVGKTASEMPMAARSLLDTVWHGDYP